MHRTPPLIILVLVAAWSLLGCGSSTPANPASAHTLASPTAETGSALMGASAATPTPTPAATPIATPVPGEPVSAITVIATDNLYAPDGFRVRAGEAFQLKLENRGQALHDWRILNLKGADGRDAGTRLLPSGASDTVTLTLEKAGDYMFYCEVHPVEMRGKLVAQ